MVNQFTLGLAMIERHLQGLCHAFGMQTWMQVVAHDLSRMSVCHQAQISSCFQSIDISNVCYPQLLGLGRPGRILDQVGMLVQMVFRIGRLAIAAAGTHQEICSSQRVKQGIPTSLEAALFELIMEKVVELATAQFGLRHANLADEGRSDSIAAGTINLSMNALVIGLSTDPEQRTDLANAQALSLAEDFGCSGEGFFTTAILCSLAKTSSIVLQTKD